MSSTSTVVVPDGMEVAAVVFRPIWRPGMGMLPRGQRMIVVDEIAKADAFCAIANRILGATDLPANVRAHLSAAVDEFVEGLVAAVEGLN